MKIVSPYTGNGKWYRGNLHTHSTNSDGGTSPMDLGRFYAGEGYDFLAITDHGVVTDPNEYKVPGLLGIPGEELSRPHIVGLGLSETITDDLDFAGQIAAIRSQGGLPILAHPNWMGLHVDEIAEQDGLAGMEIYNFICESLNGKGHSLSMYDELLERGRRFWGLAVDDAHMSANHPGGAKAWVMVQAEDLTVEAILAGVEAGDFYSSTGPEIQSIEVDGEQIHITCSACVSIIAAGWGPHGTRVNALPGKTLTEATYQPNPGMKYCRFEVRAADGTAAWSNPLWIEE
ncbi:MAG TPA: CehA/McbA family metallohydrolase [Armatimonadota bacterium]|nr:CehA/McbA family metallohydrolase [Armatimonadota bacterium]